MQDNQFIEDLRASQWNVDGLIETLQQNGITTYSRWIALLRDEQADPALRSRMVEIMWVLRGRVDRRRLVRPLLDALGSRNEDVRQNAVYALGRLGHRLAFHPLVDIIENRNERLEIRFGSMMALNDLWDKRVLLLYKRMFYDPSENLQIRSLALEHSAFYHDSGILEDYIKLLNDKTADLRFWAAYALNYQPGDLDTARERLDALVAFDEELPKGWGWHVGREALLSFEMLAYRQFEPRDPDEKLCCPAYTYLISPAEEYDTFVHNYRTWQEDWTYTTRRMPPIQFQLDPVWLRDRLREHWSNVALNVREPRPQAYRLDWLLSEPSDVLNSPLIGGLHRDQYAVVLTGQEREVFEFAAWYRGIIAPEQPLYFYEWAGFDVPLEQGMSPEDVKAAYERRNDEVTKKPES